MRDEARKISPEKLENVSGGIILIPDDKDPRNVVAIDNISINEMDIPIDRIGFEF